MSKIESLTIKYESQTDGLMEEVESSHYKEIAQSL